MGNDQNTENLYQAGLWDATKVPTTEKGATIEERFMAFHALNPQVYAALLRLATKEFSAGFGRGSTNRYFEVLRHNYGMKTKGDEYKLNNSYRSYYSRLLIKNHPRFEGWLKTRRMPTKGE